GPHACYPLVEAVRPHLPLVPVDEDRIDRHQAEPASHAERGKQICFAQRDDGDVDCAADFQETGLLEMADDERIVSRALGLQSVAYRLRSAAELRQRMKEMVRRIEAVNLK